MFNSVAKYLWGSGSSAEQDTTVQSHENASMMCGDVTDHDVAEQLETQPVEDDWEIVGAPLELHSDKENSDESSHYASSHQHLHPHRNHRIHHHHHHIHHSSSSPTTPAAGSSVCATGDADALDDAAALAQSLSSVKETDDEEFSDFDPKKQHFAEPQAVTPLQDCGLTNMDLDSNCSSDNESSPESVFSACSGRSHATYRPGSSSEAWVVAPPPCFTGSQVGELTPIASSPLENLLIEHPSMSVYLTVPPSSLPASHPFLSHRLSSDGDSSDQAARSASASNEDMVEESRDRETTPVARGGEDYMSGGDSERRQEAPTTSVRHSHRPQVPVHATPATLEQIAKVEHAAQKLQNRKSQKKNNSRHLERENKVHQTPTKSRNCRNKNLRPSGMKASRHSQRV